MTAELTTIRKLIMQFPRLRSYLYFYILWGKKCICKSKISNSKRELESLLRNKINNNELIMKKLYKEYGHKFALDWEEMKEFSDVLELNDKGGLKKES